MRRAAPSRTPWWESSAISESSFAAAGAGSGSERRRERRYLHASFSVALALGVAILAIALFPRDAHAWTPGTHVFLGDAVLRSLALLPDATADVLRAFPYDFLYGSIAADTSIAKKYAAAGRHCHSWRVGLEIHALADSPRLRAFGLGYLAHLAADSVAHNYFVPRQLTITSSTAALGHSYWESRFETHLGPDAPHRARELILLDHARADEHLDRILSPTIFSTPTNRRIFRGMVVVADSESWQRIFVMMSERSRWDLPDDEVGAYLARSYDFIIDLLRRVERSEPFALDPAGDERLRLAKKLRRAALRRGGESHLLEEADRAFGLPRSDLDYHEQLELPLYQRADTPLVTNGTVQR